MSADPDRGHVTTGAWLPRLEAARRLGITERTLQRRMKQGLVQTRHDEHNRVQVYVPDPPDTRHEPGHDMSMTPSTETVREALGPLLDRLLAQQQNLHTQQQRIHTLEAELERRAENHRQFCAEIEAIVAQHNALLAAQATPWWRVLWERLSGRET